MMEENFLRKCGGYKFYAEERMNDATLSRKFTIHNDKGEEVHTIDFTYEDPNSLNKVIEEGKSWVKANPLPKVEKSASPPVKKCRVCGCTEDNCQQCIDKTGAPCWWVEEDLCSACKEEPVIQVTDSRASAGATDDPILADTDMQFFQRLSNASAADMTLRVMESDGQLTIHIFPGQSVKGIKPIRLIGTPQEVDEGFFQQIAPAIREIKGLYSNVQELKKDLKSGKVKKEETDDEEEDDDSNDSSDTSKSKPAKKKAAVKTKPKPVKKASAPKKKEVKKKEARPVKKPAKAKPAKEKVKENKPVVPETKAPMSLFDQQPEEIPEADASSAVTEPVNQ